MSTDIPSLNTPLTVKDSKVFCESRGRVNYEVKHSDGLCIQADGYRQNLLTVKVLTSTFREAVSCCVLGSSFRKATTFRRVCFSKRKRVAGETKRAEGFNMSISASAYEVSRFRVLSISLPQNASEKARGGERRGDVRYLGNFWDSSIVFLFLLTYTMSKTIGAKFHCQAELIFTYILWKGWVVIPIQFWTTKLEEGDSLGSLSFFRLRLSFW